MGQSGIRYFGHGRKECHSVSLATSSTSKKDKVVRSLHELTLKRSDHDRYQGQPLLDSSHLRSLSDAVESVLQLTIRLPTSLGLLPFEL